MLETPVGIPNDQLKHVEGLLKRAEDLTNQQHHHGKEWNLKQIESYRQGIESASGNPAVLFEIARQINNLILAMSA